MAPARTWTLRPVSAAGRSGTTARRTAPGRSHWGIWAWADRGYAGDLVSWARERLWHTLRIVSRPKCVKGFVVMPRRWKAERAIGWCMNAHRNARDYGRLLQHSEAHLKWALITVMPRRITRISPRTSHWRKKKRPCSCDVSNRGQVQGTRADCPPCRTGGGGTA
ncbi:transposase [Streptomyces sp. NPDC008001]|uniref:transposase n=1 Tax=Streptomyces sp. NPDC008001 TaxID=3364804 RepID=UPI0036E9E78A